ncbi:MAG TPA: TraI domain-containing protein, partial [Nevskiaceae bacterium]
MGNTGTGQNDLSGATPSWPPTDRPIDVVPASDILASQSDLIIRLEHACGEKPALWRGNYLPIVQRMAAWFHQLPASRDHHHFGQGGLFRHS